MKNLIYLFMMLGAISFSSNLNAQCATSAQLTNPPLVITCSNNPSNLNLILDGDFDIIEWYRNGNLISTGTSTSLPYNKWTVGVFSAVAVCSGQSISSNSVAVNAVNITNNSSTNRICFGEFVDLEVPLNPAYTYEWRGGSLQGVLLGTSNSVSVNYTGSVFAKVYTPGGCMKFRKFVILSKGNCPELSITVPEDPYFICGNDEVGLLTIDFPSTPDSVQWFKNNVLFTTKFGLSSLQLQVNRFSVGSYRAKVFQGPTAININTSSVEVNRFTIISQDATNRVCPGQPITLVAPQFSSSPTYYVWYLGGLSAGGGEVALEGDENSNAHTLSTDYQGNIWVALTHNGCTKFSKFVTLPGNNCPEENNPRPEDNEEWAASKSDMSVQTGVTELNAMVYPNPSNGQFKISLTGLEVNSTTKISIFDFNGRLVVEKTLNINSIETEVSFNESKLSKGFYFANITNNDSQKVVKIAVN